MYQITEDKYCSILPGKMMDMKLQKRYHIVTCCHPLLCKGPIRAAGHLPADQYDK